MGFCIYFMGNTLYEPWNIWQRKTNTFRKELLYQVGTMKGPIMGYRRDQLAFSSPINNFPSSIKWLSICISLEREKRSYFTLELMGKDKGSCFRFLPSNAFLFCQLLICLGALKDNAIKFEIYTHVDSMISVHITWLTDKSNYRESNLYV